MLISVFANLTRLAVLAALVLLTRIALAQEQTAPIRLPLAEERDAYEPAVAFGNDVYLVVWRSGYLAPGDLRQGLKFNGDIVGCLLDRQGKILDSKPFLICSAADLQDRPRVAFGQGVFLVVWQDARNGKDWDVYAARVSSEGKLLDPDGILVAGGAHTQALPDVVWDGRQFQVVWQDFRSGTRYEIYGARLTSGGHVLDRNGQLLVTEKEPYSRIGPVVASSGDGKSLLFWVSGGRQGSKSGSPKGVVAGCHRLEGGRALSPPVYENADERTAPGGPTGHVPFPNAAAAGAGNYLLAWTTHVPYGRGDAPNDAQAGVLTPDGQLKKLMLTESPQMRIRDPRACWDGTRYVVVWDQIAGKGKREGMEWPYEAVFMARVSSGGQVTDRRFVAGTVNAPATKPAIASDGSGGVLIVYEQHPDKGDVPIRIGARLLTTPLPSKTYRPPTRPVKCRPSL
ncbi:MAG: hypothetical protein C4297_14590 [Gemmataceae bacterium]